MNTRKTKSEITKTSKGKGQSIKKKIEKAKEESIWSYHIWKKVWI